MANKSYSRSIRGFPVSLMNGSWSEGNTTTSTYGLSSNYLAHVEYHQTFSTLITNKIFSIMFAFGILANILLLVYLIYYKRYKTPVFCVILSLGVADLCVCLFFLLDNSCISPFILVPLWLCKVVKCMMSISCFASSYHISAFAVLRFIQLVYPLTSRAKVTTSLLLKICLTIYAIFSIDGVVIAFYHEAVNISPIESNDIYVCKSTLSQHGRYARNIWIVVVWMFVPFTTTSSVHVAKQVKVILSQSTTVTPNDARSHQVRRQTDSRSLAIVIVIYLCTMFPFLVQFMRLFVHSWLLTSQRSYMFCALLGNIALTNSAINPFIYLFAAESVRSDIRNIIKCNK